MRDPSTLKSLVNPLGLSEYDYRERLRSLLKEPDYPFKEMIQQKLDAAERWDQKQSD